jgi:hypothetical protein
MHEKNVNLVIISQVLFMVGAFSRLIRRVDQRTQPRDVLSRCAPGSDVGDAALYCLTSLKHVEDIFKGRRRYDGSTSRQYRHESVGRESRDGLMDGHPSQPELYRERLLIHDGPWRKAEIKNHLQ